MTPLYSPATGLWTCASCGAARAPSFPRVHVRVRQRTVALVCDTGASDEAGNVIELDCEARIAERIDALWSHPSEGG